jgi:hypothetical protein
MSLFVVKLYSLGLDRLNLGRFFLLGGFSPGRGNAPGLSEGVVLPEGGSLTEVCVAREGVEVNPREEERGVKLGLRIPFVSALKEDFFFSFSSVTAGG